MLVRQFHRKLRLARNYQKIKKSMESPDSTLAIAQNSILELRKGKQLTECEIDFINEALVAGFDYKDIGTTAGEVIGFRNGNSQKILARRLLEECRRGECSTGGLKYTLERSHIKPEDIGTTNEEILVLDRAFWLTTYRNYVVDLKTIADGQEGARYIVDRYEPDKIYKAIFRATRMFQGEHDFTLEDFGTSRKKLRRLLKSAWLGVARSWWTLKNEHAQTGDNFFDGNFKFLRKALMRAGATLEDVGLDEEKLQQLVDIFNSKR